MAYPVVEADYTSDTDLSVTGQIDLVVPSGTVTGNLLLIIVGCDSTNAAARWNNSTNKPSGFTLIATGGDDNSDAHVAAFWRIVDGTEGWTPGSSTIAVPEAGVDDYWGYCLRITGAHATTPIADYSNPPTLQSSASSHAIPEETASVAESLGIFTLSFDGGDGDPFSVTAGVGWSKTAEIEAGTAGTNGGGCWGQKNIASAGGSGSVTIGSSVSDGSASMIIIISPAAAGGSTSDSIMKPLTRMQPILVR